MPNSGVHTELLQEPPTRAMTWSVASAPKPKFRVFPAFGWGWGGRGSLGAPELRGDRRCQPESRTACARAPRTGIARGPDPGFPLGAARKGSRWPGMPGRPLFILRSLLLPCRVSGLVSAAQLDLLPEAFPSNAPDNRTGCNGHFSSCTVGGLSLYLVCILAVKAHSVSHLGLPALLLKPSAAS